MRRTTRTAATTLLLVLTFGCHAAHAANETTKAAPGAPGAATSPAQAPTNAESAASPAGASASVSAGGPETGLAAVYNRRLNGHKTASGERYDANALTAAHKTLPFGTKVRVTNDRNHKSVVLRINDRGPTQHGRVLDVSSAAARQLGIAPMAMAEVSVEPIGK